MQIILLKDIKKLGNKNEIKNVKDGHAMNFLIPQGLAVAATADKIKQLETEKVSEKVKVDKEIEEINKMVKKLQDKKIVIKKEASDKGKLFAAVTIDEILFGIKKSFGIELNKKDVKIKEHIKEVGEHEIILNIKDKKPVLSKAEGLKIKVEVIKNK